MSVVFVDDVGMRQLSADVAKLGEDTGAVVQMIHLAPPATGTRYGPAEVTAVVGRVLAAWGPEVELLRQACDVVSLAVAKAASELVGADDENADGFDD